MKLAVLPFNAAEGTPPALGRQFANFASDTVRAATSAEINTVSFLTQVEQEGGQRAALVNVSEGLLERNWIDDLFGQAEVGEVMDGMIKKTGEQSYELTVRFHAPSSPEPIFDQTYDFTVLGLFPILRTLINELAAHCQVELPEELKGDQLDFGTDDPAIFLKFLEGYDALTYIQQANGNVVQEFSPLPAIDLLLEAATGDPDFEGPYHALVALCRICAANRLGTFEALEGALKKLEELQPADFTAFFGLGEVYMSVGEAGKSAEQYEKAVQKQPNDPALYVRLGLAQIQTGMPVNAERNFRKALDLEGDDKPSTDYLASVLAQTNREHEIPPLWKSLIEKNPQNAQAHAKYSISLIQAGRQQDGEKAFESALETLEDNTIIKRFYAPLLVQSGDLDRAMDFYEDALDVAPNDVEVLLEYAQTLMTAKREFEVPKVLKDVLASNPDPNTRARTLAWLIELEQPKRVESVENARTKMENNDFEGAVRDLKPLRNWLADYWKMWALLSAAYNRLEQPVEAEEAARRLLDLFPACEPAYGEMVASLNAQNRNDEAYQLMRFAAANMPGSLPIHINLALAAKRAGNKEEALAIARQIREAVGSNPDLEPVLEEIERA